MFGFFRKQKTTGQGAAPGPEPVGPGATAPGTEIRYHPELIGQLIDDHHKLLEIHGGIRDLFSAGDYRAVSRRLDEFRVALQGHLLTENVRLYIYLERCLAGDEVNYDLIRGFRREMDGIGRTAMNFLRKYEAIGVDRELATAFSNDLDAVGAVLVERIQREESVLYPLYMPQY
ncbi:MAG: hemerythrin domain-containing protein [Gammaproteobacteria bacterium]|nr:hemerythrin domain-containing protein [Gammaproteobacteria bacterium]